MRRRDTVYKALCGVGIVALVAPWVAYAVIIDLGHSLHPDTGNGGPISGWFNWNWNVQNNGSSTISGTSDPDDARLQKKVGSSWDDVWQKNPAPKSNSSITPGAFWATYQNDSTGQVMVAPNTYRWNWDTWNVSAGGQTADDTGGNGGNYLCE